MGADSGGVDAQRRRHLGVEEGLIGVITMIILIIIIVTITITLTILIILISMITVI